MLKDQEIQKLGIIWKIWSSLYRIPGSLVATGNQEIDGILDFLLDQARKTLTEVRTEITIPEGIFRGNFKLCTILGNLLDNAIREAKETEQKYLGITMYTKNGMLFLRIENSYPGNIIKVGDGFRTTQRRREKTMDKDWRMSGRWWSFVRGRWILVIQRIYLRWRFYYI